MILYSLLHVLPYCISSCRKGDIIMSQLYTAYSIPECAMYLTHQMHINSVCVQRGAVLTTFSNVVPKLQLTCLHYCGCYLYGKEKTLHVLFTG